jgi:hypothetical protein
MMLTNQLLTANLFSTSGVPSPCLRQYLRRCVQLTTLMMFKIKDDNSSGYFSVIIKRTEVHSEWLTAEADFHLNGFAAQFAFPLLL